MGNSVQQKVACHECDLLQTMPKLNAGDKAYCPRCGHLISQLSHNAAERLIALSISALILLVTAVSFPFMAFSAKGKEQVITLLESTTELWQLGYEELGVLIFLFILWIPASFLFGLLYLLIPLYLGVRPPFSTQICRWLFTLTEWSMAEVFLIGVLVSLVKITSMAVVSPGISFWAYILFSLLLTAVISQADKYQIWRWIDQGDCNE